MADQELQTGTRRIDTDERSITLDEAVIYVSEINAELAEATGLDLMSAAAATIDSAAAVAVVRKLGLSGRAYIKHTNGKAYIIIKGRAGLRPALNGTRYLASNPKVAKLVIGAKDLARGAGKMTGIAIITFTGLRVVEHMFSDNDPRLTHLFGSIATDVVKFAIAAGAGFLAGAALATITTLVAGPMIAAVFVGVTISIILDRADRNYGMTEALIRKLEEALDGEQNPLKRLTRHINAWEQHTIQKALRHSIPSRY